MKRLCMIALCSLLVSHAGSVDARQPAHSMPAAASKAAGMRNGQHDFDFEIGTWATHLRRLRTPLSGSTEWVEYEGTTVVREVLDGRANLVELKVEGPAGRIEGLSLRLYNPEARQWTLNFANIADGLLTEPMVGEFRDGRGEFHAQDTFKGRAILVRFLITVLSPDSCRFEQAFSADGGKTWEVNWIATDTRKPGGTSSTVPVPGGIRVALRPWTSPRGTHSIFPRARVGAHSVAVASPGCGLSRGWVSSPSQASNAPDANIDNATNQNAASTCPLR